MKSSHCQDILIFTVKLGLLLMGKGKDQDKAYFWFRQSFFWFRQSFPAKVKIFLADKPSIFLVRQFWLLFYWFNTFSGERQVFFWQI